MLRLGMRNASAHLGRLLLTAVAVLLGVTFVSGSLVLTATSRTVLDEQFRTVTGGADLAVRRAVAFDAAMGVEVTRDPVPPSALATIRSVPGVARVQPVARGQGLLMVGSRAVGSSGSSGSAGATGRPTPPSPWSHCRPPSGCSLWGPGPRTPTCARPTAPAS